MSMPMIRTLAKYLKIYLHDRCSNINFFGLVFVIVLSFTITIIDLILLKGLVFLSKFRRVLGPRLDRWTQDGIFQLQRRAFEAEGQGSWERLDHEIPLTGAGEVLVELSNKTSLMTEASVHSKPGSPTNTDPDECPETAQ